MNGQPIDSDTIPFNNLYVKVESQGFETGDVQGAIDTLYLLYSSGTTGLPKGVMLTHLNSLYAASNLMSDSLESRSRTCYLTVVPWYHAYGLMTTINNLINGKMIVYFPGFFPEKYLQAIEKYKVNVLFTVPPMMIFFAKSPLVEKYDMSSVKQAWCAAAPLSTDTIRQVLRRLPNCKGILQAYGMTETSTAATKDPEDNATIHKPGSGGPPLPGVSVKVVDVKTRKRLGPLETGEICIKGPVVMKGYLGNEAANHDIMDDEGFLKTGDIGYYDHDGYFFIVERIKELIKYKGNQVPPAAVEGVVLQHPGVAECGVVGKPDEEAGELPTAFVVLKPGYKLSEKEILDFTATRLSRASQLRGGVIFVNEIPKNPSGKILRRVLKQTLQKKMKNKL
ncbi:Luciferin 4-monooxygenase [Papilio machaon]|uniref:Luciferin 4-monooxygenase n=1 Tax=Papilio machaon TaxID=76193 RepID=A0A194RK67_PAPMA|nr:Luciferin 4-monooxygenase [Papilio machaon]